MTDAVKRHAEKIAQAIVLCAQHDPSIQLMLEAAKKDAGLVFTIKGVDVDVIRLRGQKQKPILTVADRRFLRSMRIAVDEPAKETPNGP